LETETEMVITLTLDIYSTVHRRDEQTY